MSRYFNWTPDKRQHLRDLVASGLTAREIAPTFGLTRKAIIDAVRKHELGPWIAKPGTRPGDLSHIPEDFAERWQTTSQAALAEHYRRAPATISLWRQRLGLHRPRGAHIAKPQATAVVVEPAEPARLIKPNAYQTAPVDRVRRDMSPAGQAADILRRDRWTVFRCDDRGRYAVDGPLWRCGSVVCGDDELIERAERAARRMAA